MPKLIDLIGQKFGRLVVIKQIGKSKNGRSLCLCKCKCGKTTLIQNSNLRNGNTKSCGCLRKEVTTRRNLKHGHSKRGKFSRTYISWSHMIQRCTYSKDKRYGEYGGRGIVVSKRWSDKRNGFKNFLQDMGKRPKNKTLDRTNNDKGYYKKNCKWATNKQQANNRRKYRLTANQR